MCCWCCRRISGIIIFRSTIKCAYGIFATCMRIVRFSICEIVLWLIVWIGMPVLRMRESCQQFFFSVCICLHLHVMFVHLFWAVFDSISKNRLKKLLMYNQNIVVYCVSIADSNRHLPFSNSYFALRSRAKIGWLFFKTRKKSDRRATKLKNYNA